ncbi:DUF2341 domain-containing protein [bacterium]|jgi:hypothetical protein|nr:DUF2341 domain-containing protein [bacterium]
MKIMLREIIMCIFVFSLCTVFSPCVFANPECYKLSSPAVWKTDDSGDYLLDAEKAGAAGYYDSGTVYETDGEIQSLTVSWKSRGKVEIEVSADNGRNFVKAVNGVPVTGGFIKGSMIKWKANISAGGALEEVRVYYTDSSGVVSSFGEPRLSGCGYRKPVYFANSSEDAVFNHQLKIRVGQTEDSVFPDVHCDGNARQDFADIRFTAADGITLIPYYIEKTEGSGSAATAVCWIKHPQLPSGSSYIYIYYGNNSASSLSSGEEVFDFYDDFAANALDSGKWLALSGKVNVFGGQLKLDSGELVARDYIMADGVIEYEARAGEGSEIRVIIKGNETVGLSSSSELVYSSIYDGAQHCIVVGDIVKANSPVPIEIDKNYGFRVTRSSQTVTFNRFAKGSDFVQAETSYVARSALKEGYIGLKSAAECVSYFDWFRTRQNDLYYISIDKEASADASPEELELPYFSNISLNGRGELSLEEGASSGFYVSDTFSIPFPVRVIVPEFLISSVSAEKASLDISLDGGENYCGGCIRDRKYYSAKEDFVPGEELRLKISLQASGDVDEGMPSGVKSAGAECLPGRILVISPNGGEEFSGGDRVAVSWTALDYDESYEMKIEYSADEGGSYKTVADDVSNSGTYIWNVPSGFEPGSALIRVSDSLDAEANDISDGLFYIKSEEESEEDSKDNIETIGPDEFDLEKAIEEGERPGTRLYDLLIKVGDNVSADSGEDAVASFKNGDIVIVRPAGHKWGAQEKRKFLIVRVYLTDEEVKDITQEKKVETGRVGRNGNPVMRTTGRRKNKVDLQKLGISGTSISQAQNILNKKIFEPDVIEQK